jgi:ketosteroid isomerase-like protein
MIINESNKREENRKFVEHFMSTTFQPEWWDMLHEDAVMEFPYAAALGIPEHFDGRNAVTAYLKAMITQIGAMQFHDLVITGTKDPELFFNEYKAHVTTPGGVSYDQVYINKLRLKDGKVILIREFWDPTRALKAVGDFKGK